MAPSFQALRARLPSLYRPDDDDLADERLPISAADVLEVRCEPAGPAAAEHLEPRLLTVDRGVVVQLPEQARMRAVRLAPGLAPSLAYALTVRLPAALRPHAVAALRDDVARFTDAVEQPTFTLELRRRGVLSTYLLGIGEVLDAADRDAALILHAHWWGFADRARYSPFYLRRRELAGVEPPTAHDADLVRFPYVHDLARLAAVIPVVPWQERDPAELVEAYRLRIRRIVELYRDGLGTLLALQRMIEAELPVDLDGPAEERDRGIVLEEFAPLRGHALDVVAAGNLGGAVAPLMHWTVDSTALAPSPATVFVDGLTADEPATSATVQPVIELYAKPHAIAIGYTGTVPPDRTLRLRPAFSSWLGGVRSVLRCQARPGEQSPADPTAPGPWELTDGISTGTVRALLQTPDRALWAAVDAGNGTGSLARSDGGAWVTAVKGLAPPRCLAHTDGALLVGTGDGLSSIDLFPADGTFTAVAVAGVATRVLALAVDGAVWRLGTPAGVLERAPDGTLTTLALGAAPDSQIAVNAIARGAMGSVLYGTDRGVFEHQTGFDHWYWYAGESASEQVADWRRYKPQEDAFPTDAEVFLPPVQALHRGPDGALWIGTDAGLARYVARVAERLAFTTALEAFADLGTGAVRAIAEDAHGVVWFAGETGLMRADRRDIWHHESGAWRQLGRLDRLYGDGEPQPRGSWRFDRASSAWQRADGTRGWLAFDGRPRIVEQPAVHAVAWTDDVAADIGARDASGAFTSAVPVPPAELVSRVKPSDEQIVGGGIPALPRIPPGRSTWRYLALEREDDEPAPPGRPTWTREGRRRTGEPAPVRPDPPEPARFDIEPPDSRFDASVMAFAPAARVQMQWRPTQLFSVAARLRRRAPEESIDPAVLDRVWNGMSQVRPAGVRTALAVDETIVRGDDVVAVS